MKKGTKALHCSKCGKVVGWKIPTGKSHHGIPEVEIKMKKDGCVVDKGFSRHYCCVDCK